MPEAVHLPPGEFPILIMNTPFGAGSLGLIDATSNDLGAGAWDCGTAAPACDWALPGGGPFRMTRMVKNDIPAATHRNILLDFGLFDMGSSILPRASELRDPAQISIIITYLPCA